MTLYIDQRGTKASAEHAAWLAYEEARRDYEAWEAAQAQRPHDEDEETLTRRARAEIALCRWQAAWQELHAASEAHRAYEAAQHARLAALFADGAPSYSLAAQLGQGGEA